MAVNKNFVVKNGIEVATDVIVASAENKTVGIGTTVGEVLLDVRGAIGATHLNVSGVATIFHLDATNFNIDNLTGTAATVTSITVTNANIINGIVTSITGTSGTFTNGTITNLTGTAATITNLDTTDFTTTNGITTNGTITNLTGTAATITTLDTTNFTATNGTITNLTGTAATITNGNIINLTGTAGTITTLDVTDANITNVIATNINASGVITATSFAGDGSGLVDVPGANSYWIKNDAGIHTTGSVGVGTTNPNSVVPSDNTTILNVGILTAYKLYGDGSSLTGLPGNPFLQTVLDTSNTSTTGMSITGVSTFTTAEVTNGTVTNLTGTAATITNGTITNLTGTAATITNLDSTNFTATNGTVTNLTGTAATITNGTVTNLTGTAATITNGTITNLTGTAATITNGTITNLTGTAATITNLLPININSSGVTTLTTLDVQTKFDVYDSEAVFHNDVYVAGNLSIGGTTITFGVENLVISDKDIIVGYTTNASNDDVSTDNTANHGGVAVASTEGSPLVPFKVAGINTLPDTYKQLMWVKGDTYGVGTTDAWMSNYAVGVGSTLVPTGVVFAAGGIQFTDSEITTPTVTIGSGIITATTSGIVTYYGDGSNLTGVSAGSTVFNDTTTDQEYFPLFTSITSGTITASGISTSKLTYNPSSGEMTAVNFNSTSDESLKINIHTVENSLDIVDQLRGVSFDWKENGKSSYGVIAQELEEVLPELVAQTDPKSVNYNGIIGVLIEAIKELREEIQELKSIKRL